MGEAGRRCRMKQSEVAPRPCRSLGTKLCAPTLLSGLPFSLVVRSRIKDPKFLTAGNVSEWLGSIKLFRVFCSDPRPILRRENTLIIAFSKSAPKLAQFFFQVCYPGQNPGDKRDLTSVVSQFSEEVWAISPPYLRGRCRGGS